MVASGTVDDLVLECLAERTLGTALLERARVPSGGYDRRLSRRLRALLPAARAASCRIMTNAGAANPVAGAVEAEKVAGELGLSGLRIATVTGDELTDLSPVRWSSPFDDRSRLLGAHAYIGADPLAAALDGGADLVIAGRTSDSALFLACALADLDDTSSALAGGLAVGHILECSGQLTGGNLELPGGVELTARELADLGYPIADVRSDGSARLRLPPGAPGRMSAVACALQLLYEVHDPTRYLTPDGALDLSGVRFVEVDGAVEMFGAALGGTVDTLKVVAFSWNGEIISDVEIGYSGDDADRRAGLAAEVLRLRLEKLGIARYRLDFVGVDSLGAPSKVHAGELRLHVSAACADDEQAGLVVDEVYALTLSGPAAGGGIRSEARPLLQMHEGLIPQREVRPQIAFRDVP